MSGDLIDFISACTARNSAAAADGYIRSHVPDLDPADPGAAAVLRSWFADAGGNGLGTFQVSLEECRALLLRLWDDKDEDDGMGGVSY